MPIYAKSPFRLLSLLTLLLGSVTLAACGNDLDETAEPLGEAEPTEVIEDTQVDQVRYFTDWDLNDDTYLTETEFASGFEQTTLWEDWDADDDTNLSEDEFNTAYSSYSWYTPTLYGEWDADDDNLLSEDEWETGIFGTWDADDNAQLYENEYDAGLF